MSFDLLWTDKCLLAVLLVGCILTVASLRKPHARQVLHQILSKPVAVCAAMILCFFLVIGILDSIHIKLTDTKMTFKAGSVLDYLLMPLGEQTEKTYSAPMALTLYSTETILQNGQLQQIYPRLTYISNAIQTPSDLKHVVYRVMGQAAGISVLIVMGIWLLMAAWRRSFALVHQKGLVITAVLTLFIGLVILFATYWLSRDVHVFGTDKIGQDIYYYAIKSIRTGLVIGLLTTLFMMPLALLLGLSAGYFGGLVDDIIQYVYTTLSSIPGVLLITASVLSMQTYIANHPLQFTTLAQSADARLLALCLILGVTSWTSLCRLLRAETLKLREMDFVLAAQALGSRSMVILMKHLLPNVMHIVLITLVLDFSFLILAEAVLSYIGVGVSPMTMSWGNMINAARLELAREPVVWWPVTAAFGFMFILVLASNLFADALRDALNPN